MVDAPELSPDVERRATDRDDRRKSGGRSAIRAETCRACAGSNAGEFVSTMNSPEPSRPGHPFDFDAVLGYALLRLTLGLNFLLHSYSRWHDGGKFVETVVGEFAHLPLPAWSVRAFAWVIPCWEPAVGLLLVLGLGTRWALGAGALLIALLTAGTALRAEYPVLSEQLIYALTFFVLFLFRARHDRFGIDGWRAASKR